jgi:hypothetical protein
VSLLNHYLTSLIAFKDQQQLPFFCLSAELHNSVYEYVLRGYEFKSMLRGEYDVIKNPLQRQNWCLMGRQ